MHPYFLQLALLGLGAGFMAGLLGIGGGMVIVPFLTLILATQGVSPDLTIKMAIATSMAVIMFTSLSSVRAHHKRGAVLWELVQRLTPGIVLGSLVSSLGVFAYLKGSALAIAFGLFVAFSATQMFLDRKPQPNREMPGTTGTIAAGGTIGFVSGLVGAGGGFITVPFMTWCNVAIHNAVATSAALGFPIAVANVAGYIVSGWSTTGLPTGSIGYMWLPGVVVVASGSMLTAPIGARMAHALPVTLLKKLFGVVLYALAGYMLHKGLTN